MIWGIGYAVVGLVVAGVAARRMSWRLFSDFGRLDWDDIAMSLIPAVTLGAFWPLTVVGVGASWLLRRDLEKNHPKAVAARQRERQRELDERQYEIERLERELGISERY